VLHRNHPKTRVREGEGRPAIKTGQHNPKGNRTMANTNNRPVTFSPEALMAIIRSNPEVLKELMPLFQPVPAAPQILADPPPAAPKKASEMEQAVVQAFSKREMHGVAPKQDVLTKWKWAKAGYLVADGQKGVKVRNLLFYHFSQVRPATSAELQAYFDGVSQRKLERQGQTSARLPTVSPVQVPLTVMPAQPQPDPAVVAEIERLKRENAALKSGAEAGTAGTLECLPMPHHITNKGINT
jgi:hypothetical protein